MNFKIQITADSRQADELFSKLATLANQIVLPELGVQSKANPYFEQLSKLKIKAGYSKRQGEYLANAIQIHSSKGLGSIDDSFSFAESCIDNGMQFEEVIKRLLGN